MTRRSRKATKVVGAGIVVRRDGRILIARRCESSNRGGLWEFPGGSIEKGESMQDCIARELLEELAIHCRIGERLVVVLHEYGDLRIELHAHWARIEQGRPRARHCADYAWVTLDEMREYAFSAADLHIVSALKAAAKAGRAGRTRS